MCVCPALTARQCQGREGVAEIVAWNYDAHTPNFPSLSEVRASGYAVGSFPPFHPRRASARVSPSVHPYLVRAPDVTPRLRLSTSPFPASHSPLSNLSLRYYTRQDTRAWQRRLAPSNQRPIICLHVFTPFCANFTSGPVENSVSKIARSSTHLQLATGRNDAAYVKGR